MAVERFSQAAAKTFTVNGSGGPTYTFTAASSHAANERFSIWAHFKYTKGNNTDVKFIGISIYRSGATVYSETFTGYNEFNISLISSLSNSIPAGSFNISFSAGSGSGSSSLIGTVSVDSLSCVIGIPSVVAGNPILVTDFTDVNQRNATKNTKITSSHFTAGNKITASAWNTKWGSGTITAFETDGF